MIIESTHVSQNIDLLIAAGCSFTEVQHPYSDMGTEIPIADYPDVYFTWPVHLMHHLKCKTDYQGRGGAGNRIISTAAIHSTLEALKTHNRDNILVGIMWSGSYRHDVYYSEPLLDYHEVNNEYVMSMHNPTSIVGVNNRNYYKVMPYWDDELSKTYYKNTYDDRGSLIATLEHILRTQWFLKVNNVKYFMTSHHPFAIPETHKNHPDVNYLWDAIDWDSFLPVKNEWDWLKENVDANLDSRIGTSNPHPTTEMNQRFTNEVIIPYLKERNYI